MPSKFYEYLVAQGATAEEAKGFDTPIANKAFEKLQAEAAEKAELAAKLDSDLNNYQTAVNKWHEENNAKLINAQNEAIAAKAEEARHRAALLEAQKKGLFDVAKDLGWTPEPPKNEPPAIDSRYMTKDEFGSTAKEFGGALARLVDLSNEHEKLFGSKPNLNSLLEEARAHGKDLQPYWAEKFKVGAAREAAAQKEKEAEIAKWKMEGAKEKETELVSKFGNPLTRPMSPSQRPIFAARTGDAMREGKKPWEHPDGQLSNDRVERATKKLMERQLN